MFSERPPLPSKEDPRSSHGIFHQPSHVPREASYSFKPTEPAQLLLGGTGFCRRQRTLA